jgi:hypothetical protein
VSNFQCFLFPISLTCVCWRVFFSATIEVHNEILALGRNTIYNTLYDNQQFVASIIFRQPRPPQVWWSPDYKLATVKDELVDLSKVRAGLQAMLAEAWTLLYRLTGGKKFANNLPEHFKDDLVKETRGYSFLDHGPFTKEPHPLMAYLIRDSHWSFSTVDALGRLSFNMPAIHGYLKAAAELNRTLCVLCYVLPIMSNRISQFVGNKLRNMDRRRNTNMLISEMVFFNTYHKMSNATGIDLFLPAFVPPPLRELMLEYLCGGIREVEQVFGGIAHGLAATEAFRSYVFFPSPHPSIHPPSLPRKLLRFLWVQNGVHMTETAFSTFFPTLMRRFCDTGPCPRSWRQVAISWAREYIPPRTQTGAMHTAVTHSTHQDRSGYGVAHGDLPMVTPDMVWEQREACGDWWDALGVGSATVTPQPIRFARLGVPASLSGPLITQESLTSMLTAAFDAFQASLVKQLPELIGIASSHNNHSLSSPLMQSSPAFRDDAARDPPGSDCLVGEIKSASSQNNNHLLSSPLMQSSPVEFTDPDPVPHSHMTPDPPSGVVLVPSTSDAPSPIPFTSSPLTPQAFEDLHGTSHIPHLTSQHPTNDGESRRFLVPYYYGQQNMSLLSDEEVMQLDNDGVTAMAHQGICMALANLEAVETCPQQLWALKLVIRGKRDFILVIRTGGGKSLIWQAWSKLRPRSACIVAVPYVSVLQQHLESSLKKGIVSAQYTAGSDPPPDFQNLFIQPETGACRTFSM